MKRTLSTTIKRLGDELKRCRAHFNGKRVLCNCEDPRCSNFFKISFPIPRCAN